MATSVIDVRPQFIITAHSYRFATSSNSLGANSRRAVSAANLGITAPDGYTYAGVRSFYVTNTSDSIVTMNIYQVTPSASTALRVHNQYGDANTNAVAHIEILWVRDDYLEEQ